MPPVAKYGRRVGRRGVWALALGLGLSLLVSAPAMAAKAQRTSLPASGDYLGVDVISGPRSLTLVSCDETCEDEERGFRVELPEETSALKQSVEKVSLGKERSLLELRYTGHQKAYVVLVLGAARGGAPSPVVALKGWVGQDSPQQAELVVSGSKDEREVLLTTGSRSVACGRTAPASVRRLNPTSGLFRPVRASVLSDVDRKKAQRIELSARDRAPGLLLSAQMSDGDSVKAPVDTDRKTLWVDGHDEITLAWPELDQDGWVLEVKAPLTKEEHLYVLGEGRSLELVLAPGTGTFYDLSLPDDFPKGCLTLVQPRTPASVTEVMQVSSTSKDVPLEELVSWLRAEQTEQADLAVRALAVSENAAPLLAARYGGMDASARERAREVAGRMGVRGLPIIVAVLEFGTEAERASAVGRLLDLRKDAVPALRARLKKANPAGTAHLARVLAALAPEVAAQQLPLLLKEKDPALRSELRTLLSELAETELPALNARLSDGSLGNFAEVELVRALKGHLNSPEQIREVERLSAAADFAAAYKLSPVVLALAGRSKKLEEIFLAWLSGQAPEKLSEVEQAALSFRALELLYDAWPSKGMLSAGEEERFTRFMSRVPGLSQSKNPRLRATALTTWSLSPTTSPIDPALTLLSRDPWPFVRSSAARLLSAHLAGSGDARISAALSTRLRREPEVESRRAVARALSQAKDEKSLRALRKAFSKDADYAVRADAAVALGERCDVESLAEFTHKAHALMSGSVGEGQVLLGLASVTALVTLNPPDLDARLAPLISEKAPGMLKAQVKQAWEAARQRERALCTGSPSASSGAAAP